MPSNTLKFKVLRRVKGLIDADAAKGKAPSIHQPGEIITLDADDERIEALVKSRVIEPAKPGDLAAAKGGKAAGKSGDSSTQSTESASSTGSTDPAALQKLSVEKLRKIAVDEFEFAPASIAKFTKDEMLALLAEAIAKKDKA